MKSFLYTAIAALLTSTVSAFHYPTPKNGQIGVLDFPLTCNAFGIVSVEIDGVYTATAPLTAQSGQQIYYTDVTASVTIPPYLVSLANGIGAVTANTQVFIDLTLSNASPSTYHVFPMGFWVNGTTLNSNRPTVVKVPLAGVLDPIGPVTLGLAGVPHNIQVGRVEAKVNLFDRSGKPTFVPIDVVCPIQTPQVLLAAVNVLPKVDASPATLLVQNGYKPDFLTIGLNQQYGCFDFDYQCAVGGNVFPLDGIACGGLASYYGSSSKFSIQNATIDLIIPADTANTLRAGFPSATSIQLDVSTFYLNTQGVPFAPPVNAVGSGLTAVEPIPASGPVTLSVPNSGVLTIGQFTTSAIPGTIFYVSVGNSTSHVTFKDGSGASLGGFDFQCGPAIKDIIIFGLTTFNAPAKSSSGFGF